MEKVDLQRYEITGRLGTGADYEVKAATDRETGQQVAIKRVEGKLVKFPTIWRHLVMLELHLKKLLEMLR